MKLKSLVVCFIVLSQLAFATSHFEKDVYAVYLSSNLAESENEITRVLKKALEHSRIEFRNKGLNLSKLEEKTTNEISLVKLKFLSINDKEDNSEKKIYGVIKGKSYSDILNEKGLFFLVEQEKLFSVKLENTLEGLHEKLEALLENQIAEIQRNSFGKENPLLFLTILNRPVE